MSDLERILFIPDTHAPYHNKCAFDLVIKAAKSFKPTTIVIMGDFADFYSVSSFNKNPKRKLQMEYEINETNTLLDKLDSLKAKKKIYVAGNHEHRLERFMWSQAPALDGLIDIRSIFKLKERGYTYVPYRDHYKLGKVYITHDIGATSRNSAHKVIDTYQHSAVTGHTHRIMYAVEADGLGEPILSAQFGWLGDIKQVDYAHKIIATKAYVLGFGVGWMDKEGIVYVQPVPIVHNKCCIGGKVFTG